MRETNISSSLERCLYKTPLYLINLGICLCFCGWFASVSAVRLNDGGLLRDGFQQLPGSASVLRIPPQRQRQNDCWEIQPRSSSAVKFCHVTLSYEHSICTDLSLLKWKRELTCSYTLRHALMRLQKVFLALDSWALTDTTDSFYKDLFVWWSNQILIAEMDPIQKEHFIACP